MSELFGVIMVDALDGEGRIVAANPAIHDLLGYGDGELIGARLDSLIPERSHSVHHEHRAEYMQDPQTRPMGPDREVYIRHKDGTETRVWVGLDPQKNGLLVSAVILDVEDFAGNHQPLNP